MHIMLYLLRFKGAEGHIQDLLWCSFLIKWKEGFLNAMVERQRHTITTEATQNFCHSYRSIQYALTSHLHL